MFETFLRSFSLVYKSTTRTSGVVSSLLTISVTMLSFSGKISQKVVSFSGR